MRLLSVDLPWGQERFLGLAWTDSGCPTAPIRTAVLKGAGSLESEADWAPVRGLLGDACDVVLLDQPIGMIAPGIPASATACRPVELAWANRFFCLGPNGRRIQFPRFQPGNAYAAAGVLRGRAALQALGTPTAVAVECFPQLVVPVLLQRFQGEADAVTSLAAHKPKTPRAQRVRAQAQLLAMIERFTGRSVAWPQSAALGGPAASDVVDAALGLVTGLGLAHALPADAPDAVRLTAPLPFEPPLARDALTDPDSGWWQPAAGWLVSSRRVVRNNGIAALRWW